MKLTCITNTSRLPLWSSLLQAASEKYTVAIEVEARSANGSANKLGLDAETTVIFDGAVTSVEPYAEELREHRGQAILFLECELSELLDFGASSSQHVGRLEKQLQLIDGAMVVSESVAELLRSRWLGPTKSFYSLGLGDAGDGGRSASPAESREFVIQLNSLVELSTLWRPVRKVCQIAAQELGALGMKSATHVIDNVGSNLSLLLPPYEVQ